MRHAFTFCMLLATMMLAACATNKSTLQSNKPAAAQQQTTRQTPAGASASQYPFMEMVNGCKTDAQNIVADIDFTTMFNDRNVTIPGQIRMRKNQVVRIQLFVPVLHTEVGRLEFTPDYVLLVDRMHKQYVKGDYSQVDFLRDNGLNFYSLQALFWNELFVPGATSVGEGDLAAFKADIEGNGKYVPITLTNGNMSFTWKAERSTGLINEAKVEYSSASQGKSTLVWDYSYFESLGGKQFPSDQTFTVTARTQDNKTKRLRVEIKMDGLSTNDKWDAQTQLSSKYEQVDAEEVLGKLLSK